MSLSDVAENTTINAQSRLIRNQAYIALVQAHIEKGFRQSCAARLIVYANQLSHQAGMYLAFAHENFELSQNLNSDDVQQQYEITTLVEQADDYRSQARQLDAKANQLRSEAWHLLNR